MSSVGHAGANASDDKLLLTVDKISRGQRNTSTESAFERSRWRDGRFARYAPRLRRFESVTHKLSTFENCVHRGRKLFSIGLQQISGSNAECALHDFGS
jgi:hypothetical protein